MTIRKVGVMGWPITHSLSPRIHNYWMTKHHVSAIYEKIAVQPDDLKQALKSLLKHNYVGVNLTLPHKERALEFMDKVDSSVHQIGAMNTVTIRNGSFIGSNTDSFGFIENLKQAGVQCNGAKVLLIGAGGAAKAVCYGLIGEHCHITVINRTFERAQELATSFKGAGVQARNWEDYPEIMKNVSLVVNATSLGMTGQPPLEISLATLPATAVVTDIVYYPLITPLLQEAQARGNKIVDGLGMLLYQAQGSFKLWFGIAPDVTQELRELVLKK